jgi:hypothetical protein
MDSVIEEYDISSPKLLKIKQDDPTDSYSRQGSIKKSAYKFKEVDARELGHIQKNTK